MRVPIGRRRSQIKGNRTRDRLVNGLLRTKGWTVLRIWEHELRRKAETRLLRRLSFVCGTKPGRAYGVRQHGNGRTTGAAPK